MRKRPVSSEDLTPFVDALTTGGDPAPNRLADLSLRVSLGALLGSLPFEVLQGDFESRRDDVLTDIVSDSRKAGIDVLFLAIPGVKTDGHLYVSEAYDRGCRVFVVERAVDLPEEALILRVRDARGAHNALVRRFFGHPERSLRLIGVTGTKGKTTVAHMLGDALTACGVESATIGTTGLRHRDLRQDLPNTTPDMYVLMRCFDVLRRRGVRAVVMEVSSAALKGRRVEGLHFDYAVLTNIGSDHISPIEHVDFDDYRKSKAKLFGMADTSILNKDDPSFAFIVSSIRRARGEAAAAPVHASDGYIGARVPQPDVDLLPPDIVTYSLDPSAGADVWASDLETTFEAGKGATTRFNVHGLEEGAAAIGIPGDYNVANALAVIAVMHRMGFSPDRYQDALRATQIPGRSEWIDALPGVTMMIDYAHNAMSMRAVLEMLSGLKKDGSRLIVLFGAVGGRAQNRRKGMAEAVSAFADVAMVTTDCPYDEDPEAILDELLSYMSDFRGTLLHELDRRRAIRQTVCLAKKGDIVLFAGMGDDDTRTFKGVTVPYSEKAEVLDAVAERMRAPSAGDR